MKKVILLALLFAAAVSGIAKENEAAQTMRRLEKTSPFLMNDERRALLKTLQGYSEKLSHDEFNNYLKSPAKTAARMEEESPILYCYRHAFHRVLDEVQNTRVEPGTTVVWLLYNMGIVVKTPSGCFGVDVNHRLAEKLAPFIDFLCVTHNHGDHKSVELMAAMRALGKPVLSNFNREGGKYWSTEPAEYKIGAFSIRTDIADHNEKLLRFITMYRVDCGADSGNFSLLHCGDSNFTPAQFTRVQGPVGLLVLRYGAPEENRILGNGDGRVQPACAILSHVIELRHRIDKSPRRRTLDYAVENLAKINCPSVVLPFWGEKLVWKNGKLQ